MLFQDEVPEDKGLFTFYREQAEREEELKRQRRLRKKRKEEQAEQASRGSLTKQNPQQPTPTPRQAQIRHYLPKTINNPIRDHPPPPSKPKSVLPKQRLQQSIVDMSKDIDPEPDLPDRHLATLRHRQPSHILRNRRYREKAEAEWTVPVGQGEGTGPLGGEGLHIESLHRRNQSEQLHPKLKQAIHSVRGSVVELPQIRKSCQQGGKQGRQPKEAKEAKLPYRPKKSLKSKLIQDALLSRDRDKIKQIRSYLKAHSPLRQWQGVQQQLQGQSEHGMEVFEFRQQKLLAVLKRFRRGS